jgi:hypothetical protein
LKQRALWRYFSISGGEFRPRNFFIQWNEMWVHIPCHNACEARKRCDTRTHTLPPCSGKVGQNGVYSGAPSYHGVSWLWNKIYNKLHC